MDLRRLSVIWTLSFAASWASVSFAQQSEEMPSETNAAMDTESVDGADSSHAQEFQDLEQLEESEDLDDAEPESETERSAVSSFDNEPDEQDEYREPHADSDASATNRRTHLGIGFGSGFGLATGDGVIYGDDTHTESGLAASPVQLYIEAGRTVVPNLEIVLSGQFQAVFLDSGLDLVPRVRIAARYQVLARDRWTIGVQAGGGYGYQVHYVKLDDQFINRDGDLESITETDRTEEGPGHLGAGAYFRFAFSDRLGLFVDTFIMGMFPQASVHLDANIGLDIRF